MEYLSKVSPAPVELGAQLMIDLNGIGSHLNSIFIGLEAKEYVIIKAPKISNLTNTKNKLIPGLQITVRYIHKGNIFGFQTKLINYVPPPRDLLFIKYPEVIENHNLRSYDRTDCFLPAFIINKGMKKDGAILDISKKGCRHKFLLAENSGNWVSINDEVILMCQFPGVEGQNMISGKVRNISENDKEVILGIEFTKIKPIVQGIINNYLKKNM